MRIVEEQEYLQCDACKDIWAVLWIADRAVVVVRDR